jgi:hypothetical protein
MRRSRTVAAWATAATVFAATHTVAQTQPAPAQDPYEKYVKTSKDFQPIKQDKEWALKAWPSWTFMPWYHQWTVGFDDASGAWSRKVGFNGAFTDHGNPKNLPWINKFKLRFYNDHTAGKGDLHIWDGGAFKEEQREMVHGTGMRIKPLNAAMMTKLQGLMRTYINNLKSSPHRAAYALDDELSWGHFVHPTMWQVTDTPGAYENWLKQVYGPQAPERDKWYSYNDILPELKTWSVAEFDASPLMDQWTFNDSWFNNFLGDLAVFGNTVDPATPVGHVGGQSPSAFGGYDYAKMMRKCQFIEAYNIGGSQAVIRSFNPHNALPTVTTFFYRSVPDTVWQTWYYLAQGNRGFIAWVADWFEDKPGPNGLKATPKPWIAQCAPHFLEAGEKIGPLMRGAEWIDDGVAIYYSHPSIQLHWIMDSEAHGKTWINRNEDAALGTSQLTRKAWENMLRDEGLQFTYLDYASVIQKGIPSQYKVLILPATLCLSDAEARQIKEFCNNGGTVIADFLPGLWDQHGKGRTDGGVLDEMFGIKHDPKMTAKDVFGEALWCETNQDANYSYKTYVELMTKGNTSIKDKSGFDKAVRKMGVDHVNTFGKGKAVLMNLSPQWYNAYRQAGFAPSKQREVFIKHVKDAGLAPWVRLKDAGAEEFGYEITYWTQGDRTIVFLISNVEVRGTTLGGGNAVGLKSDKLPVTLAFAAPIKDVRNERAGAKLEDGKEFKVDWTQNQAVVLSFAGAPPRQMPEADAKAPAAAE